jgi:hypothetical protein
MPESIDDLSLNEARGMVTYYARVKQNSKNPDRIARAEARLAELEPHLARLEGGGTTLEVVDEIGPTLRDLPDMLAYAAPEAVTWPINLSRVSPPPPPAAPLAAPSPVRPSRTVVIDGVEYESIFDGREGLSSYETRAGYCEQRLDAQRRGVRP